MNLIRIIIGVALLVAAVGCARPAPVSDPVTDQPPTRVASLVPSLTEVIIEVGGRDQLVGISDHCKPEGLPRLGGLKPNTDDIIALAPELVLADVSQDRALEPVRKAGIRVEVLPATSAATIETRLEVAERAAALIGRSEAGLRFAESIRSRIREVEQRVALKDKPTVVYISRWEPLKIAGGEYVEHDVIRSAGGQNIGAHLPKSSAKVDDAVIHTEDPDVVVVSIPEDVGLARTRWPDLRAVQRGRIYTLDLRHHPGTPHSYWYTMAEDVERLAEILHPDEPD
jgi:ABC-type Fe3+-hydroxamate transport system substrate-binding protein